jgi:hypothetical protein
MTTLYRCPSVRSNKVVTDEYVFHDYVLLHSGNRWHLSEKEAIEANRIKRNKLIARKSLSMQRLAREIQKLAGVY